MEKTFLMVTLMFTIESEGRKKYTVRVYNILGKKIYETYTVGIPKKRVKDFVVKEVYNKIAKGELK